MKNPTIEELQDEEKFELIATLEHTNIKEFVIDQLSEGGKLVVYYMFYQAAMMLLEIFVVTRSIVLAYHSNFSPLYYTVVALLFSFTLLIPIHELIHGLALKVTGAPKVDYGAYLKKFIFYAEADQHILNQKQFEFVALAPFVVIKILTLAGILLFFSSPLLFSFITVMTAHSLFCAGDIGLLNIFYRKKVDYTYDLRAEKRSYYFKRKK